MSILDEARTRMQEGRIQRVDPILPGRYDRGLYVEAECYAEIEAALQSEDACDYRLGQLFRDFDRFSSGKTITVGYGDEPSCFFKLLDPQIEGVWEIRSRDPSPAIRVFGSFIKQDVFLATHYAWRSNLGGKGDPEWDREIRYCKVKWRQLFPTYDVHTGASARDYISQNVIEIRDLP